MLSLQQTFRRFDLPFRAEEVRLSHLADLIILLSILFVTGFVNPKFAIQAGFLSELDLNHLISDRSGSNFFNQVKWLGLAGLASILVICARARFFAFAYLAWPVVMLCAIALLSKLWSMEPSSILRRAIRATISIYTLMAAIAFVGRPEWALAVVYLAFFALLLQNMVGFAISGSQLVPSANGEKLAMLPSGRSEKAEGPNHI